MLRLCSYVLRRRALPPLYACVHCNCTVIPLMSPMISTSYPKFFNNSHRIYSKLAPKTKNDVVVAEKKKVVTLVGTSKSDGIANRINKFFIRVLPIRTVERFKLLKASHYLYEQLTDEVNVAEFFEQFELPDTFASWFIVMELHVYVLAARLFKQDSYGIVSRDMVTDAFWDDVQLRSSKLGERASLNRRKQIALLGYQFQAAFYGYDEGVQANDMVLAAVVWRRFFGFECDDAQKVERVVKYIRVQLDYLNTLSFDDIVYNRQVLTIPLKSVHIG